MTGSLVALAFPALVTGHASVASFPRKGSEVDA